MEYIALPTKEQFLEYSGELIDAKLQGDVKNPEKLWETLCKRAYREIKTGLPGIQIDDLEDDDLENWHILIMEQCEYYLSLGDKVLTGEMDTSLSPNIARLAREYELWSPVLC